MKTSRFFALVVAVLPLAGCVETPAAPAPLAADAPILTAEDGRDLRTQLQASDQVAAPQWRVGDWFGHHVFFGNDDSTGRHYSTMVVEDRGDEWVLATDDRQAAKEDAVFDIPILGPIQKADLSTTGLGADWKFYQFPLTHGSSWVHAFPTTEGGDSVPITFTATYDPDIPTPDGERPGFEIRGTPEDGRLLFSYDYVPDIGWYAHFFLYDIETEDPDDFFFHVSSMGHGSGWTGTYYTDAAKLLVESFGGVAVDPNSPANSFAQPAPPERFTMDPEADYLFGFAFAFAFAGVVEMVLVDPDGNRHELRAVGAPDGGADLEVDMPAVPGEWTAAAVGAGAVAIHGAFLWQITEVEGTL